MILVCLATWLAFNGTHAFADAPAMVKALSDENALARFQAEEDLVRMGDAALPALEPLSTSGGLSPGRQYAIHVVARIGTSKAVTLLLKILDRDPDVYVRGMICEHVGRMGVEEAVPIIGGWLLTIRGKSFDEFQHPVVRTAAGEWMRHIHALREIGSEKGVPILEELLKTPPAGRAGKPMVQAMGNALRELKQEATFWKAVRGVAGLEPSVKRLFDFWRRDNLALMRLYRMKVIALGTEGRWALEDTRGVTDAELRQAAEAVLKAYDDLARGKEAAQ